MIPLNWPDFVLEGAHRLPQLARNFMSFDLNEWTQLLLRWVHVFAGILWVGTTYYFTWLDGRFSELEAAAKEGKETGANAEKHVWMVHSGGFYLGEKQKFSTGMPGQLHWVRWE